MFAFVIFYCLFGAVLRYYDSNKSFSYPSCSSNASPSYVLVALVVGMVVFEVKMVVVVGSGSYHSCYHCLGTSSSNVHSNQGGCLPQGPGRTTARRAGRAGGGGSRTPPPH